jgi:hypothetical protein
MHIFCHCKSQLTHRCTQPLEGPYSKAHSRITELSLRWIVRSSDLSVATTKSVMNDPFFCTGANAEKIKMFAQCILNIAEILYWVPWGKNIFLQLWLLTLLNRRLSLRKLAMLISHENNVWSYLRSNILIFPHRVGFWMYSLIRIVHNIVACRPIAG